MWIANFIIAGILLTMVTLYEQLAQLINILSLEKTVHPSIAEVLDSKSKRLGDVHEKTLYSSISN